MDSPERFNETSLSPKSAFYSKLKGDITDDDYEDAQKVRQAFGIRTIYMNTDVVHLADVFENS